MAVTNEQLIKAVFTASPANKSRALKVLEGREAVEHSCPPPTSAAPLFLNIGEAARLLGVSRVTIWRMVRDGKLEKVQIYESVYRIRRSDIDALVNARPAGSFRAQNSALSVGN